MTIQPRNKNPLHYHTEAEEAEHPWTADTLAAHLQSEHGIDGLAGGQLAALKRLHDGLNHGPSPADEILYQVMHPERRLRSAQFVPCRDHCGPEYSGHQVLVITNEAGTHSTRFCIEAGDRAMLAAAVIPEDLDLKAITEAATAALGLVARKYVQQAHARGYSLGVADMEATPAYRTAPVTAAEVRDFLRGLMDAGAQDLPSRQALAEVFGYLERETV